MNIHVYENNPLGGQHSTTTKLSLCALMAWGGNLGFLVVPMGKGSQQLQTIFNND